MKQFSLISKLVNSLHIENDNREDTLEINELQDKFVYTEYHKHSIVIPDNARGSYAVESGINGLRWIARGSTFPKHEGDWFDIKDQIITETSTHFTYIIEAYKVSAFTSQQNELVKAIKSTGEECVLLTHDKTNACFA